MQQTYGDQVDFIGVAGRDNAAAMAAFVSDYGVGAFPHIADADLQLWREFGITSQPAFVFINDDGTAGGVIGGLGEQRLIEQVKALISS